MVIPALLVGVQAIRTNGLVRGTLESLGERLARSRTYAEVEDAMFNQTQVRSEEHTSELQSRLHLVCRLLLEKKKNANDRRVAPPTHTHDCSAACHRSDA